MEYIFDLINLLEISRMQPQYGYAMAGGNSRMGNLAEHHYLVAMTGWQLAELANKKGALIDVNRVLQLCLMHDIGELFGGDIGTYYAMVNSAAKDYAKKFESENFKFLTRLFVNKAECVSLSKELLDCRTDEAILAKLADYIELTHYKLFTNSISRKDLDLAISRLSGKAGAMRNVVARQEMMKFIGIWANRIGGYSSFLDASIDALAA